MPDSETAAQARLDLDRWRDHAQLNSLEGDPFLRQLLLRHLGDGWRESEPRLHQVATAAGSDLDSWVNECNLDENLPRLKGEDALGRPTEEVRFHPSHHEAGRIFWGSGVLSVLKQPGQEVLAGAIAYLLDQHGEAGHACPVACTAGAIKLLQRLGTDRQRSRYLPGLLESDYDRRLHAAQFVTEVQGGSDVGLNACRAIPDPELPDHYRIFGEKWFCSVADAELFVVSARLPEAAMGTRGLGLFLVPRRVDGKVNGFRLRRLKNKLGTRSMPTGEIEFDGALAEPIGPLDQGFKNLVGIVLDTSRVHNALAACGIMRRAFVEAQSYARERYAFEHRIQDFPGVQQILARMKVRTMASLATTFRILAISDRLDTIGPDEDLSGARRIAVMINKYWTAVAATHTARDGIELLGGNGTIEDFSVLPRLYRDAIVVESWEGTHNTLCAQVLRDFAARGLHSNWLRLLSSEIEELTHARVQPFTVTARNLHHEVVHRIERLSSADETSAAACIRHVVDRMCHLTDWLALSAQAQWEADRNLETDTGDALDLYRMLFLDATDPQETPRLISLQHRLGSGL